MMNQMRKVIQEAILEELDAMGLPESEKEMMSLEGEDAMTVNQDIIDAGLSAVEELGAELKPEFLASLRASYDQAKESGNTKPIQSYYKMLLSIPDISNASWMPNPENFINLVKALAFSDDDPAAKEVQFNLLKGKRFVNMIEKAHSNAANSGPQSQSEETPSMAMAMDVPSDSQDEPMASDLMFTVKEAYRLSNYDLLAEAGDNVTVSTDACFTVDQLGMHPEEFAQLEPGPDEPCYSVWASVYNDMLNASGQPPLEDMANGEASINESDNHDQQGLDLDRFTWGQAKEAPQPGVETDGQLTESRGSLIRNRYYGRY